MWDNYLHQHCREYEYSLEAEKVLVNAARTVAENEQMHKAFGKHLSDYKQSHNRADIEASLMDICELAKDFPTAHETVEFLFFVLCSEHLKQLYQEEGYPEPYFRGVMLDMRYKLEECHNIRGIWGSMRAIWFIDFFALLRFAIGRLQYEVIAMPECMSADGQYCFGGEKAVNVHIPSAGPLKREEVQESFRQATNFYADCFPGDCVLFTCQSWLLFPMHFQMLPENSGIRQFMDEFTIIHVVIDKSKCLHLWRVFGTYDVSNPETLPRNTSLQRIYAEWLEAGKPIGDGLGIKYVKKE